MLIYQLSKILLGLTVLTVTFSSAVEYPTNPSSADVSLEEKTQPKKNKTYDLSEESGHEDDISDEINEKKYLEQAMRTILDPNATIIKPDDTFIKFKIRLETLELANITLDQFIDNMDNLSLEVCKSSQNALWSYVTDIANNDQKNKMIRIAAEEDETKKQYWNIIKRKYLNILTSSDPRLMHKLRIIQERGTNVQMSQSKQREEIDVMQRIWSRVAVRVFNSSDTVDSVRTMSDILSIFKKSNNSRELAYYWKAFRDATGKKIRPIFKDYVTRMNSLAQSENFTDAGEMWRYAFEDENFVGEDMSISTSNEFAKTIDRLWQEVKPLYNILHDYVRSRLKRIYKEDFDCQNNLIPAHLLGNLWAQEWQSLFPKVATYPDHVRPQNNEAIIAKDLFDVVDQFHQSLGFESAYDSYADIKGTMTTINCLPSSHDMCDGVHYKINWCGEKVSDITVGLSRAARLLGHVQYFKHYSHLSPLYRDGPNPAFHDAISDIVAVQLTSPDYLKTLNFVQETGPEVRMNNLLWVALEKLPLMAYAYVLDKWRWDVFANSSLVDWNQHWWDMRIKETGVSPPVQRNESDLDPAAKYHVVSHVQYITYFVSHILEFQILSSLCKAANHTGPLHECSIYGVKEAGKLLSDGMTLGASENWREVLKTMTGETELSSAGILEYFSALKAILEKENKIAELSGDMDRSAPIIVGVLVVILTIILVVLYCLKKHDVGTKVFSIFGLSTNGSLDIATNEISQGKSNQVDNIIEDKV